MASFTHSYTDGRSFWTADPLIKGQPCCAVCKCVPSGCYRICLNVPFLNRRLINVIFARKKKVEIRKYFIHRGIRYAVYRTCSRNQFIVGIGLFVGFVHSNKNTYYNIIRLSLTTLQVAHCFGSGTELVVNNKTVSSQIYGITSYLDSEEKRSSWRTLCFRFIISAVRYIYFSARLHWDAPDEPLWRHYNYISTHRSLQTPSFGFLLFLFHQKWISIYVLHFKNRHPSLFPQDWHKALCN